MKIFLLIAALISWDAERKIPHISASDFMGVLRYGKADDVAEVFRAGRFPSDFSYKGMPVLMLAILESADAGVVEYLADNGADVNAVYSGDFTVLMSAAKYSSDPQVIDVLIEAGADTKAVLEDDTTALMLAEHFNPNREIAARLREPHSRKSLFRLIRRGRKLINYFALRLAFQFL